MPKNDFDHCPHPFIDQGLVARSKELLLDDFVSLKISNFFKVLADPTRIKIIHLLYDQELCVCHLAELLNMNQPAVSQQLKTLKQANIVKFRREGHNLYYTLSDDCVKQMITEVKIHVIEHKK